MDEQLKNDIIHAATEYGCDLDGDILWYQGEKYYVHIFDGVVRKADESSLSYMQKAQYLNLLMLLAEEHAQTL